MTSAAILNEGVSLKSLLIVYCVYMVISMSLNYSIAGLVVSVSEEWSFIYCLLCCPSELYLNI